MPRQILQTRAPGHAQLHAIIILYGDSFSAPIKLVPRRCATARLTIFRYRDRFPATYQPCTATHVMLNKICTRTAKTRAIPSLHRDSFVAKVPGPCPDASSGNATSLYCRAVIMHSHLLTVLTYCNICCKS